MKLIHIETGIDQHPVNKRFRVNVEYKGTPHVRWFAPDETRDAMRRWRESKRVTSFYNVRADVIPTNGQPLFERLADAYIDEKRLHMTPSAIVAREFLIGLWTDVYRGRDPRSIDYREIESQLRVWKKTGNRKTGGALGPVALNHRLKVLSNFFRLTYKQDDFNPCRHVAKFAVPVKLWRLPSMQDARRAVASVGDGRRKRLQATASRIRLQIMLETGFPQQIIKRIKAGDIHWTRGRDGWISVEAREKGGGTRPIDVPLSHRAAAALREFDRLNLYGDFSNSSMNKALRRACKRIKLRAFHPYMLRHRFITSLLEKTADEFGVSQLSLHTSPQQMRQYARHARTPRMESVLSKAFGRRPSKRTQPRADVAAKAAA